MTAMDHSAAPGGGAEANEGTAGQIARILRDHGLISAEQLAYATRVRSKLGEDYSLVRVLKELGYLSDDTLRTALRQHGHAVPLGNLLVELGHLRPAELAAALQAQTEPEYKGKRLGEFLVEKHLIQEQELIEVLADQLGFASVEPRLVDVSLELMAKVKPDWCRKFGAIPLQRDNGRVQVAFVDPLDRKARTAMEGVFGEIAPAITSRRVIEEVASAYESKR